MSTYAQQRERELFQSFFGDVDAEEFDQWAQLADFAHNYPDFLPWLQLNAPERYEQLAAGFKLLAVDATDKAWRGPNGGRPAQLLPGTEGAASDRTDWRYWLLLGGRGCVAAGTIIHSPFGYDCPVEQFEGGWVWALNEHGAQVPALASPAFWKGQDDLFKVTAGPSYPITVTSDHRFLTQDGWARLGDLKVGDWIATADNTKMLPVVDAPSFGSLGAQFNFSEGRATTSEHGLSHSWHEIQRVESVGVGGFYDLTVPGYQNYAANWIFHHNSGKSLSGAHGVRELLFATPWTGNVRVGFIGRTLDDCRSEMFIQTFMQLVPPGSILNWKNQDCILTLALPNGHIATITGYSAETPNKVRGPNLHLGWADELASWQDAGRGTAAVNTTWSNLNYAVRVKAVDRDGNLWRPRIIATTTPQPVRLLHNLDPHDGVDPGLGLHQDPKTVVSSMSTLENLNNLGEDFYESAIAPYEGTRLYDQEVLGKLMMEAVGALWSSELIEAMGRHPTYPLTQGGGLVETVVGVDPAVSEGRNTAEHGIIVVGRAADGCCYILQDASMKGRPSELCDRVAALAKQWNCSRAVVEVNQGGSWLSETMGRAHPWLRVEYVWAKKSKRLRAEPAALLSDKGRLFLAGSFPKLSHQMRTYTGEGPSPDRLDAMVYAVMFLMPNEARIGQMVRVVSKRLTRR